MLNLCKFAQNRKIHLKTKGVKAIISICASHACVFVKLIFKLNYLVGL